MSNFYCRCILIVLALMLGCGCSYYQPTKNVWKTTKGLWNEYLSPPASVDYEDKGDLSEEAIALSKSMMGVDTRLARLERVMQNADKPPTQEWLSHFMEQFPWMDGFAGVKYDGSILGQYPPDSLKELDFNPLLYEDKRQNSRALRCDAQPSPLGPEIMVATPLYDGVDFLGVVVAYFEMRSLMRFSENPENIVVLCPTALLWPGKYEFAATPLAGVDWNKVVKESSAGTCSNATGTFFYLVRYLGNLPLIFAVPEKGDFPAGNGDLAQGAAFFPQEREKMAPPPLPERPPKKESEVGSFGASEEGPQEPEPTGQEAAPEGEQEQQAPRQAEKRGPSNEIQPGSRDSMLLRRGGSGRGGHVRERQLEGENVEVERVQRPRVPARPRQPEPTVDLLPDSSMPTLPGGRPSPFGPRDEQSQIRRPSPFGPAQDTPVVPAEGPSPQVEAPDAGEDDRLADGEKASPETPASPAPEESKSPASETKPSGSDQRTSRDETEPSGPPMLPGGRPSPFGPRR